MRPAPLTLTALALAATLTACSDTDPCDGHPVTPAERRVLAQGPTYEIEHDRYGVTCELSADTGGQWAREGDDHTTTHTPTRRPTPRTTR